MKMRLITRMLTSVALRSTAKESKEDMTSMISKEGLSRVLFAVLQIGVKEYIDFTFWEKRLFVYLL